jgi:hypothetical protein
VKDGGSGRKSQGERESEKGKMKNEEEGRERPG